MLSCPPKCRPAGPAALAALTIEWPSGMPSVRGAIPTVAASFEALWAATPTPGRRAHVRKASKFYFHALRGSGSATFRSTTGSGGTGLRLHLGFTSSGATIEFARVFDVE